MSKLKSTNSIKPKTTRIYALPIKKSHIITNTIISEKYFIRDIKIYSKLKKKKKLTSLSMS